MAIKSPLEEFIVSRKYNEKEQRPVMDYETPINVEGDAIASDAEMAPYMQGVYDEETPSVVETEEAIEQIVRQPAAQPQPGSQDSNLWYFLPAALGALTGNIGEGSAASAGVIGDARKRQFAREDYEKTLADKLKMMQAQRKGDSKLYEVDKDGNRIYATREQAIGQLAASKPSSGSSLDEKIKLYRATRGEDYQKGLDQRKKNQEEKESREVRKDFLGDKQVAPTLVALDTIKELRTALDTPGWAGAVTAQAKFIRGVLKEVGNLNEQEQARAGMSPAIENRLNQFFNKLANGDTLTDTDRKSLKDIMNKMENVYVISLNKKADQYIKSQKNATGRDIRPVLEPFIPKMQSAASYEDMSDEQLDKMLRGVR